MPRSRLTSGLRSNPYKRKGAFESVILGKVNMVVEALGEYDAIPGYLPVLGNLCRASASFHTPSGRTLPTKSQLNRLVRQANSL